MTGKNQDAEFRHPDMAAYLQSLTKEEAAKQPSFVRESGGITTQQWREGDRVRRREVEADELPGAQATEVEILLAATERCVPIVAQIQPCTFKAGSRTQLWPTAWRPSVEVPKPACSATCRSLPIARRTLGQEPHQNSCLDLEIDKW